VVPGAGVKYRCKIFNLVTVSAITALERFILQLGVLANRYRAKLRKANYPSTLTNSPFVTLPIVLFNITY